MRVLILTTHYPNPFQPERNRAVHDQARRLAEHHSVEVIAPIAWTDELHGRCTGTPALPANRRLTLDGVPVRHPHSFANARLLRPYDGSVLRQSVRTTFARTVRQFRPEVLYTPWVYPDGWAAVQLGRRVGLPVVLNVVGDDLLALEHARYRRLRALEALETAAAIVVGSQDVATRLLEFGASPARVRVVADGIDETTFFPGSREEARGRLGIETPEPLLLFVGSFQACSGALVLLAACDLLARAGVGFQCRLIGAGPQRGELAARIATVGLPDRVVLHGPVPRDQLPDWYRAATVCVLPSYAETIPSVLLEAAACGTPFVASRVGGIPEITHLAPSRLVDAGDAEGFAQAIRLVLDATPQPVTTRPRTWGDCVHDLEGVFEQARCSRPRRRLAREA